jgi:hypothetical protein
VSGEQGLAVIDVRSGSLLDLSRSQSAKSLKGVAISPDGRLLVGARAAGGFVFWRASWQDWFAAACDRLERHQSLGENRNGITLDLLSEQLVIEPHRAFDSCERGPK